MKDGVQLTPGKHTRMDKSKDFYPRTEQCYDAQPI